MGKKTINLYEAKVNLSKLVARVERGEEIIIAKAGRPVAKLVAVVAAGKPRSPGVWKGRVRVGKNFDAPLPKDLLDAFEAAD